LSIISAGTYSLDYDYDDDESLESELDDEDLDLGDLFRSDDGLFDEDCS
jgi:hypothetical protein